MKMVKTLRIRDSVWDLLDTATAFWDRFMTAENESGADDEALNLAMSERGIQCILHVQYCL